MLIDKYIFEMDIYFNMLDKTNKEINNLSISRFESTPQGFILWLTYSVIENETKYKAISEILLDFNGNAEHIRTEKEITSN